MTHGVLRPAALGRQLRASPAELCAQQGRDTEPWDGIPCVSLGLAAVGLCAHGDGWDAAATVVSPFPRAG